MYHISYFKSPLLAEHIWREQPHSTIYFLIQHAWFIQAERYLGVVCDLSDGGGCLQLACEDPVGQAQVMRRLVDVHRVWGSVPPVSELPS